MRSRPSIFCRNKRNKIYFLVIKGKRKWFKLFWLKEEKIDIVIGKGYIYICVMFFSFSNTQHILAAGNILLSRHTYVDRPSNCAYSAFLGSMFKSYAILYSFLNVHLVWCFDDCIECYGASWVAECRTNPKGQSWMAFLSFCTHIPDYTTAYSRLPHLSAAAVRTSRLFSILSLCEVQ